MARVLILGGTGLISSAIVPCLIRRGDDVILCNRGKTLSPAAEGARLVVGDRKDSGTLTRLIQSLQPLDAVIDMIGFNQQDCEGLIQAAAGKVKQVIFCSTVDVYAKPLGPIRYPVSEDEPQQGLNPYGRGKVECEKLLRDAERAGAFAVTILRPAHTYNDRGTLIHAPGGGTAVLDRLRRGLPVIVHGDGTSLWCQAHADDVGPAFAAAVGQSVTFGKSYNVAGEEWISWNQIYEVVCAVNDWPRPDLVHISTTVLSQMLPSQGAIFAQNFQFSNVFCNMNAKQDLGYQFTVDLAEGARRVVRWLTSNDAIIQAESQPWYDACIHRWIKGVKTGFE